MRATTVIPILNRPLCSIYLSLPFLLFCRLLDTTGVFPIGIVVSPPPLIYPQTVSITLEGWCAKGSLVFTTGNPLYIHVTFSRSFSVGRVVNFPKFQFILSAGPLGHPPITPLCSSNWAQDPGCPSPLLDQNTHSLAVILLCFLFVLFFFSKGWPFIICSWYIRNSSLNAYLKWNFRNWKCL